MGALLGTTLTSYAYIWETIGRGVEAQPDRTPAALSRAKAGAVAGSVVTAVILWCMLVVCAATLDQHHATVSTAGQAAAALKPLAGQGAADVFAAGHITSAVVALPVLMATTAYVVGAQFDWRRGLSEGIASARGFRCPAFSQVAGQVWESVRIVRGKGHGHGRGCAGRQA